VRYLGFARHCPICGSYLWRFIAHGPGRPECECPVCGSLQRERLTWLYLRERTDLLDSSPKRMRHMAPECQLGDILRRTPRLSYASVDIADPHCPRAHGPQALAFPDRAFDVVYCGHVLEHVPDDRRAMAELYRVVKPGVPGADRRADPPSRYVRRSDGENPLGASARVRHSDHVRIYGRDFKERLESVGFSERAEAFGQALGERRKPGGASPARGPAALASLGEAHP
jgi:SAM-dependent methyltransferase